MTARISVQIDPLRIRANVAAIAQRVKVPVLGVVKTDAYGLGAARVCEAIADLVGGFCVFSIDEGKELSRFGKPILALGPPLSRDAKDYLEAGVRPAVSSVEQAKILRAALPVLSVDTGMQRFACPADQVDTALCAGDCKEAYTHATKLEHVERLLEIVGNQVQTKHAAGTKLLDEPRAWLNAVRPGLAMYRGAMRVTARLIETHDSAGKPAGYTGFSVARHGVILGGYSNGLRPGICQINGQKQRVIEVGMQSSFVEIGPRDRAGDEVVLLGDSISEDDLSKAWGTSPQEVLVRFGLNARQINA